MLWHGFSYYLVTTHKQIIMKYAIFLKGTQLTQWLTSNEVVNFGLPTGGYILDKNYQSCSYFDLLSEVFA